MVLNLIDSLFDEKQFDNSDKDLLSTIDCLINSLRQIREKVRTINHDDTYPLNLSKPKLQEHIHDDMNSTRTLSNFALTSPLLSQPFFPPFPSKSFLDKDFYHKLL